MPLNVALDARAARRLPWLVAAAFFMQTLDGTILNTSLPSMAKSLHEDPLKMQGVFISYLLTVALLIPVSGWISDRFGSRKTFVGAIGLFTLGSLLCALSQNLEMLIASRVVQGVGGAMMLPVGRLVVLRAFPRQDFVRVMSFIAVPGLIGPLLGPVLGGWLVQYASWHWIFLINIPIGVIGAIAAYRDMPDLKSTDKMHFDVVGFILIGIAMVGLTIALDSMGEQHRAGAPIILTVLVASASLAIYWARAHKVAEPLFSPKLLATRSFSIGILGNLFARLGSGAMPLLIPLLLQVDMGYTPSEAGMMLIPLALGAMAIKPLANPIIERWGYRKVLTINTLLLGLGLAGLGAFRPDGSLWVLLGYLSVLGLINSMQFTAMNTVTLVDLPDEDASAGNSLLSMVVQLSMSFGVAVGGALLGAFSAIESTPVAFSYTFVCVGLACMLAAGMFLQLDAETGKRPKPAPKLSV